jgi:hypothetical protein
LNGKEAARQQKIQPDNDNQNRRRQSPATLLDAVHAPTDEALQAVFANETMNRRADCALSRESVLDLYDLSRIIIL